MLPPARIQNAFRALAPWLCMMVATPAAGLSFTSFDTRSMALGGAGVACAEPAKAVLFNPALLSVKRKGEDDRLALSVHAGARLIDRDGFIDGVRHYQDSHSEDAFERALDNFNTMVDRETVTTGDFERVSSATEELLEDIEGLSNRPLRIGGALGIGVARPGRWGWAGFAHGFAIAGSIVELADRDRELVQEVLSFGRATVEMIDLVTPYVELVEQNAERLQSSYDAGGFEALEQELRNVLEGSTLADSTPELVSLLRSYHDLYLAAAIDVEDIEMLVRLPDFAGELRSAVELQGSLVTETGFALSRRLSERRGLSVGAAVKLVRFETYDYRALVVDATGENFRLHDHRMTYSDLNLDLGIAGVIAGKLRWGVVVRNLIPRDYRTIRGNMIELRPQARLGLAWESGDFTVAADLDLTRNEPLGFDPDKHYAGLGIERRWSRWMARAGVRYNVVDKTELYSLGIGVGIGPTRLELSAAGAGDALGMAMQFDMAF